MSEWEDWAKDDSAWDAADEVEKETSGGAYLKLANGESVQLVIMGPPHAFKTVWVGGQVGHSEIYDPAKHDGEKPRGRFMFSIAARKGDSGPYEPMLLEASSVLYSDVKAAVQKYGAATAYEMTRKGVGKDTEYKLLYDHKLVEKEAAHVQSLDHFDPAEAVNEKSNRASEPDDLPAAASQPFDDDDIVF